MGSGLKGGQCRLEAESSLLFPAGPNFAFKALGFAQGRKASVGIWRWFELDFFTDQSTRCAFFPNGKRPKGCAMPSWGRFFVTVPSSSFSSSVQFWGKNGRQQPPTAPEAPVETWISRREPRAACLSVKRKPRHAKLRHGLP